MSKRVTELEWMISTMRVGGLDIYVRGLAISTIPLSNLEVC
jgi:hypothetical protein